MGMISVTAILEIRSIARIRRTVPSALYTVTGEALVGTLQGAIDSVLRTTTIEDLLRTGHDMTMTALPGALVPLHDPAKRGPASPVSK